MHVARGKDARYSQLYQYVKPPIVGIVKTILPIDITYGSKPTIVGTVGETTNCRL